MGNLCNKNNEYLHEIESEDVLVHYNDFPPKLILKKKVNPGEIFQMIKYLFGNDIVSIIIQYYPCLIKFNRHPGLLDQISPKTHIICTQKHDINFPPHFKGTCIDICLGQNICIDCKNIRKIRNSQKNIHLEEATYNCRGTYGMLVEADFGPFIFKGVYRYQIQ